MSDLKPCPFCGGKDIEKLGFSPIYNTRPHIHCRDCGVDVYDVPTVIPIWHRNDSMVQAWNTRAERTAKPVDYPSRDYGFTYEAGDNEEYYGAFCGCSECGNFVPMRKYCMECGAKFERREE